MKISMLVRVISLAILTIALSAWASALSASAPMPPPNSGSTAVHGVPNGAFSVAIPRDGTWQVVGELSFDRYISRQQIDLSSFALTNPAQVRVAYSGANAAHIDSVTLGGQTPFDVVGASESPALVAKKLARVDYDVIDAAGKTLTFIFGSNDQPRVFSLAARIESEQRLGVPIEFPTSNIYGAVDGTSRFYSYRLNSVPGTLKMNGDLNEENLGAPFFKEWSCSITGHPFNFTYGWVRNDAGNLYVALDFVPDNTYDEDEDYAAVYVKTAEGVVKFKVSVPERKWGVAGFVYTDKAVYQHKVYEFKIPLSQVGVSADRDGAVGLAFEAYGTFAICPGGSHFDPGTGTCVCSAGFHFVGETCVADAVVVPYPLVGPPRWSGLGSPPKNSKLIGTTGGNLDSPGGDATVTIPGGVLPDGTTLSISQPYPNGLPRGTFVLRGDGDHLDAVSFTDANGNPITSFSGNITLCFNLTPGEVANAGGVQNLSIQLWNGGSWVTVPMTATPPVPPATTTQVCTQFSSF